MLFILGFTFLLNLDSLMIFYCLILTKLAPSCLIPTPVPNSGSPGPLRSAYLFSQFSSVTQLSLTLCDPMDCSTQDLPGHHQLPEPTQTHVHCVGDAIQPSHPPVIPFSSCSFSLSQDQGLFQMCWLFTSGSQSIGASASASVLPMNILD